MADKKNPEPLNYATPRRTHVPDWLKTFVAVSWMVFCFSILAVPLGWIAWWIIWWVIDFSRTWGGGP